MNFPFTGFFHEAGIDFLDFNPEILHDYSLSQPMKAGGGDAAFLDLVATIPNLGSGSDLTQTTATEQGQFLPVTNGESYLYLPKTANNAAKVVDQASVRLSGDFTIEAELTMEDWSPGYSSIASKWDPGSFKRSYMFRFSVNTGILELFLSSNGSNYPYAQSTVAVTSVFSSRDRGFVQVQYRESDNRVQFYTSSDGLTWTQLGADVTLSSSISTIYGADNDLWIGARGTGSTDMLGGVIHSCKIYNSIDGTDISLDVDFAKAVHSDSSFVCETSQTVEISNSGLNPAKVVGYSAIRLDGVDDWYHGTTSADLDGCYMFAVYDVLGVTANDRVLSMGSTGNSDTHSTAYIPSLALSGDLVAYASAGNLAHTSGYSGRILHRVKVLDGEQRSLRNGADLKTGAAVLAGLQFQEFGVGAEFSNGNANSAIDLLFLGVFPHTLSEGDADDIEAELNRRFEVY